jgi:cytochrome c-type protein NapC
VFGPTGILIALIGLAMLLAVILLLRPTVVASAGGKILAFVALLLLPAFCVGGGMSAHLLHSEQTHFCVSCHVMEPYGQSLYVDDPSHIPAAHFQNHRVPADSACYACHADYTIYGPLKDKLAGVRRIYMRYIGTPPPQITVRGGYKNGQCLRCHGGARNFEGNVVHQAVMDSLKSNQMSCISSGCHDTIHTVEELSRMKFWRPSQ